MENVNANFIQEYQETTLLGLKTAGPGSGKLHIGEIDCRLKHHLYAAQKAFTTVDGMCEHLQVCCLMTVIKDCTSGTGLYSNTWKMADNMIIASSNLRLNIKEKQLLSLNLVLSVVKLAQHHLELIPQNYKDPSLSAFHVKAFRSTGEGDGDLDNDPTVLQAHITKKQLFASWDQSHDIPPNAYSTICLNVTQIGECLKKAAVDSASPIDIQNEEELAQLTCGPNVFLEGIIPGFMEVPAATCSSPTINVYGRLVVKGKGILHKKATSKVI
eukprot:2693341-Rhodomonas_salina.1